MMKLKALPITETKGECAMFFAFQIGRKADRNFGLSAGLAFRIMCHTVSVVCCRRRTGTSGAKRRANGSVMSRTRSGAGASRTIVNRVESWSGKVVATCRSKRRGHMNHRVPGPCYWTMPGLLDYAVLAAPYTSVVYLPILLGSVTSALGVDNVPDPST
eukprot:SAG22_NODE_49_length_24620_cov_80.053587_14_plen_159_part_00